MRYMMHSILLVAAAASPAFAQSRQSDNQPAPYASDGGTVEIIPPRPVGPADDPVNQLVAAETTDGLVVTVTIDGSTVTLDSVTPARIPRPARRTKPGADDGVVMARAYSGGDEVGAAFTGDPVLNASEESGLVRLAKRQVSIALPAARPATAIEIEAPASRAKATFNVASAYDAWCKESRDEKICPRPTPD